jgi:thioredoxin 1
MNTAHPVYDANFTRDDVDALATAAVLNFGTNWCGYCQAAMPAIVEALHDFPGVRHVAIEDGPGRSLGRSFRIKLWPTLVFLKEGAEVSRLVRPTEAEEIRGALRAIS